jgi:hypothetical protein
MQSVFAWALSLPTNKKLKTHVALNLMFLKVLYARARVYSWACVRRKGEEEGEEASKREGVSLQRAPR